MKALLLTALAVATSGAALAEPKTRTYTYDGPNRTGSHVVTRDTETRTTTRDTDVFRKSDGTQLYARDATVTRVGGQVTRSVDVTRQQGFRPRARIGRR